MREDLIPETATEALAIWDSGRPVFTVEMGGIGPGYEQCIQVLVFELIRDALNGAIPMPTMGMPLRNWGDETITRLDKQIGFSGAQVGAAKSLAGTMLAAGYAKALDGVEKARRIQASKGFPSLV